MMHLGQRVSLCCYGLLNCQAYLNVYPTSNRLGGSSQQSHHQVDNDSLDEQAEPIG